MRKMLKRGMLKGSGLPGNSSVYNRTGTKSDMLCHCILGIVFPLLKKIQQYKAPIEIAHFSKERGEKHQMARITQKQVFENECSWGRRSWLSPGATLPVFAGKATPDHAGCFWESCSKQAWKKGARPAPGQWPVASSLSLISSTGPNLPTLSTYAIHVSMFEDKFSCKGLCISFHKKNSDAELFPSHNKAILN